MTVPFWGLHSAGGQGGLHRGGGAEGPEYLDRGNRGQGQFRGDVGRDTGQPQHPDVDHLPGVANVLQVTTGVVGAAQDESAPGGGLVERFGPGGELAANGGPDEVRAVGVETLLDQQVYLAEIDQAQVDSDLLGLFELTACHPHTIQVDGMREDVMKQPPGWLLRETGRAQQLSWPAP